MTTSEVKIFRGPIIHELVDALKDTLLNRHPEDFYSMTFHGRDNQGAVTGFERPIFKVRVTGLDTHSGKTHLVLISGLVTLANEEGYLWRIDDAEYGINPNDQTGVFPLRLLAGSRVHS